jgi:uncharacterized phage protein (TIGR02220 family)
MKLKPKKWADFQHYKDRCPPWIKLQKSLLDDYDFQCLHVASRALAPMLWLLASESTDGVFDADIDRLAFRLRADKKELSDAVKELIEKGFFIVASDMLAGCLHDAVPEAEAEAEAETTLSGKPDHVPKKPKAKNYNTEAAQVLEYLNQVCGTRFQPVQASLGLIASRLREGATVDEMRGVVDRKHKEWAADSKMREFLRPKTLFNATNYASYQGASAAQQQKAAIPFDRAAYEAKRKAELAADRAALQRDMEAITVPVRAAQ